MSRRSFDVAWVRNAADSLLQLEQAAPPCAANWPWMPKTTK
jgi:hypothetical protein